MFLVQANEIEFGLTLEAVSPLLIRDGRLNKVSRVQWLDPVLARIHSGDDVDERKSATPSAVPVCRNSIEALRRAVTTGDPVANVNGLEFYVPGSSLRGVWRSYLESLLRGLTPVVAPKVCDPLNEAPEALQSCSKVLTDLVNAEDAEDEDVGEAKAEPRLPLIPYHVSCPVCRLFGNTHQGGRVSISDGERIGDSGQILSREHVSIDRKTGKVSKNGPYKFFGLKGAKFEFTVKVVNFELWQLRLLADLFRDAAEGLVPIGSCKSKGYGTNKVAVDRVRVAYFGAGPFEARIYGVAEHPNHGAWFQQRYGIKAAADVPAIPVPVGATSPWRKSAVLGEPSAVATFLETCMAIDLPMEGFRGLAERGAVALL
jgi:CRISPR/Cas system CSM-associated protein Csm3 (group 7 of RAMP superfamily)